MPQEPRPMKVLGTPGQGKGAIRIQAMNACDCGCGAKNRFEFQIGQEGISIDDPALVRAVIEEMLVGFKLIFPDEKQPCAPGP
jgi:hypothetical protein